MREAQKPDHIGLNSLLTRLKDGRYMVPDFQREFEWEARDIRDLARSIFRDYYIGSLLLWRGTKENFDSLSCEPIRGQSLGQPEYIVLDGQQRLTAINYAFVAPDEPLPGRKSRAMFFLRVDKFVDDADDAFGYFWTWGKAGAGLDAVAHFFGKPEKQYRDHVFPLAVMGTGGWHLYEWVGGYASYWKQAAAAAVDDATRAEAVQHVANAEQFGADARSILETFQISYIELDRELQIEKVCDIFTQINSKGVRLDVFDLMNAMLKPKQVKLKELWREAAPRLEFLEGAGKLNVYILQVMSLRLQTYCSPKFLYHLLPGEARRARRDDGSYEQIVVIPNADTFVAEWTRAVNALERAIETLRHPHEFGVSSAAYLPYVAILPVFAAALEDADGQPPERRLAARKRFALWYWASIFTNQYSASSETTAARDLQALRAWFADAAAEPPTIAEFRELVPKLDLVGEAKKGFARYNAIFNLAVIEGARDWITGAVPLTGELNDHHIVPKSWGAKHLPKGASSIDSILNRTPLTDHTNQHVIAAKLPNVYLAKLIADNGRAAVESILASHFISPAALNVLLRNPFGPEDYEAFIRERQRTIIATIEANILDERADLPPDLRALDEGVERIELGLRALVAARLGDDTAALPSHVRVRVDERIANAAKKLPAGDDGRWTSLTGALEFADLQDIRSVLESNATARLFADLFPNKPSMANKFTQLGELRNSIRHSRTVSDVVRHEGHAAIHWFNAVLAAEAAASPSC